MTTTPNSERTGSTSPTVFGPPFDDADADIILRSSDQVDFRVYKVILSKASLFFKDMFSLPRHGGTATTPNSCTIVYLPESSKTLAALLTTIYPLAPGLETDEERSLSDHLAAIEAAKKYDMAPASFHLLQDFENSACVKDSPVEAFCVAYTLELREAAQMAAKASLKHRLSLDDIGNELQHTNGPALFQLWQFHRACSSAAVTAIPDTNHFPWITRDANRQNSWWELAEPYSRRSCKCNRHTFQLGDLDNSFDFDSGGVGTRPKIWVAHASWNNYIERARNALKTHPCSEAITHYVMLKPSYKEKPMCNECQRRICGLSEFSRYLGEEVEKRVSEVALTLPF
ncbi:hypothetical protein BJV78DRAFT_585561 [Lactifluus subvellereus]|nr:hypothetical protein BJV78DRAFT_585561 [Lactifluus subvellereus]